MIKTKVKKGLFILLALLFISLNAMAQKNAVFGTFGLYTSVSIERTVSHDEERGRKLLLRVHGGKIWQIGYASDDEYAHKVMGLTLGALFGNNSSSLDLGAGVGYGWTRKNDKPDGGRVIPNANIGYRYEAKYALFRIGVGFPELLYVSAGFRL